MTPPPIIRSFEADLKANEPPPLPAAEKEEHCTVDKNTVLLFATTNVVLVSRVAPTQFVFVTIWAVNWQ